MPNHVTTILTIEDAANISLAAIRKEFINDEGQVDFNLIVPMPKCLEDFEPHSGIISRASAALGLLPNPETFGGPDLTDITKRLQFSNALRDVSTPAQPDDVPNIVRAIQNHVECGHMYWYDWCSENWGTKWGAYGQPDEGHPADAKTFKFQTAWSHPRALIDLLSKRLPCVLLHVRFADEDLGSNCGEYRIQNGVMSDDDSAPGWDGMSASQKRTWTGKAFRICYGDDEPPAAHGYNENWEYSDDVYDSFQASRA